MFILNGFGEFIESWSRRVEDLVETAGQVVVIKT